MVVSGSQERESQRFPGGFRRSQGCFRDVSSALEGIPGGIRGALSGLKRVTWIFQGSQGHFGES